VGTQTVFTSPVRFADFEFDTRSGQLRRGDTLIKLQQQPAKVLAVLISRPGEVVTRQELARAIWGSETFVDFEQGLNFAIRHIRTALGDDAERPRFLQTLPKQGYRFIAPVSGRDEPVAIQPPVPAPALSQRLQNRTLRYGLAFLGAALAGIVLMFVLNRVPLRWRLSNSATAPRIESLAVLPLHNLSRDPEQEYFSDGMTDELITDLAKFGKLRVISHTSVERYKETKRPLPEIARELGVDAVVEGTVMRSSNRVRITAQLIEARSDRHLWAESYERDLRDVLALQDDVAQQIATQIGINLTAGERARRASAPVVDPAAHEAYLKGLFYWNQLNCDGSRRGLEYFQQAAEKDPHFAEAEVGVAQAYFTLGDWGCLSLDVAFPRSKSAALKAIELNPGLGAAHESLGWLAFFYELDWPTAEREMKRAIELDPGYSISHLSYALLLVTMKRNEEGLAELKKARALDPTSEMTNMVTVHTLYLADQFDQAIAQAKTAIELYPRSWGTYYWLGAAYEKRGMYDEAAAAYLQAKVLQGIDPKEVEAFREAYRRGGIRGFWQQEITFATGSRLNVCVRAVCYAHLGDKERTLEALRQVVREQTMRPRCTLLRRLNVDPIYDGLRDDPRFKEILARIGP
jgi:TolB-like protein/DNA-binding winged helix-turn-helix (wHTH) protein